MPPVEQLTEHAPQQEERPKTETAVNDAPIDATQTPESNPTPANVESQTETAPFGVKKDGTPAKKRGRKPKEELAAHLDSVTPPPPRPQAPPPGAGPAQAPSTPKPIPAQAYDAAAGMAANLFFNVGVLAVGDDWAPEEGETKIVYGAFRDYFVYKNIAALDPGYMLAVTLIGYGLKRTAKPTVRQRLSLGVAWLKSKMRFGR